MFNGSSSSMKKGSFNALTFQDRKFQFVLYPDSETYVCSDVLDRVRDCNEYAYILHDCDVDDVGELIKPHYHVVVRFLNPKLLSTVSNQLGLELHEVRQLNNFKAGCKYLCHRTSDSSGKYQYDVDSVVTNISLFRSWLGADSEIHCMSEILSLIDDGMVFNEVLRYCLSSASLYSVFRRNYSIIHNYYMSKHTASERTVRSTVSVDMSLLNSIK